MGTISATACPNEFTMNVASVLPGQERCMMTISSSAWKIAVASSMSTVFTKGVKDVEYPQIIRVENGLPGLRIPISFAT